MLLDVIIIVFTWMGVVLNIFPMFTKGTPFDFLPFNWLGVVFFVCALGLIRWRGQSTTAWKILDFPVQGQKLGVLTRGAAIRFITLYTSIAGFLKTKDDKYYKDDPDGAYGVGGHDARLIDSDVSHVANTTRARMVHGLSKKYHDYEELKNDIRRKMIDLKTEDGKNIYILTGTVKQLPLDQVDIESNKAHKELFEFIMETYFEMKVHGQVYTLKNYHRFQDKQAAPYQIGSVIHYIKAKTAMEAARVKKSMGDTWKYIAILGLVIVAIIAIVLVLTGTIKIPGLPL